MQNNKNIIVFFKINSSLKNVNKNNFFILHFFNNWLNFIKFYNLINGKDFKCFFFKKKTSFRFTFSGSPHTQTKKRTRFNKL